MAFKARHVRGLRRMAFGGGTGLNFAGLKMGRRRAWIFR
jgi:hypothetical protein